MEHKRKKKKTEKRRKLKGGPSLSSIYDFPNLGCMTQFFNLILSLAKFMDQLMPKFEAKMSQILKKKKNELKGREWDKIDMI